MNAMQEIADRISDDSMGLSRVGFSILPYRADLEALDPLDFVVWHAPYTELYFTKLMFATAFVWKDLSWQQWQEGLLRLRHDFQALWNLLTFLAQYLEVDAFAALKEDPGSDPEMIDRLKPFFSGPLTRPSVKDLAYLSQYNEAGIDLSATTRRLYQEGAPKAALTDSKPIRV